jgi:hypothetical protein
VVKLNKNIEEIEMSASAIENEENHSRFLKKKTKKR